MATILEILVALGTSFGLNLIPFAGPSNLLIASTIAVTTGLDPLTIALLVSTGAVAAKLIHYLVTFFIGKSIHGETKRHIDATGQKLKRWAFLALFIVAATPIPDEPVIVPLGLIRYSPIKFCVAYFLGKLSITLLGAFLGKAGQELLSSVASPFTLAIASIILTIIVTIAMFKIDVEALVKRIFHKNLTAAEEDKSSKHGQTEKE